MKTINNNNIPVEKLFFFFFSLFSDFLLTPREEDNNNNGKKKKIVRVFSIYPSFYLYLYLLSNTEREKRQTREREITRPFEWIDSAQWWRTGIFVFLFFQKFSSVGKKELAKVESNWKHVRYTSICKHAFYIYSSTVYLYRQKRGALTVV